MVLSLPHARERRSCRLGELLSEGFRRDLGGRHGYLRLKFRPSADVGWKVVVMKFRTF